MHHVHATKLSFQCAADRICWLPGATPEPPDLDGIATEHKLLAVGHWSDDVKEHLFTILDVHIKSRDGRVRSIQTDSIVDYFYPGSICDLQVADVGGGEVMIIAGGSSGGITVSRLRIPRAPGTRAADLQVVSVPLDEQQCLLPCASPHTTAVASVDLCTETGAILTSGADGALALLDARDPHPETCTTYKRASHTCSFTAARWTGNATFATVSPTLGLCVWDVRHPPSPVLQQSTSERSWCRSVSCLAVHPSRPSLAATGGSGGDLAAWDLRHTAAPLASTHRGGPEAAPIWQVRFDTAVSHTSAPSASTADSTAALLFCNDDGVLGRATLGSGGILMAGVLHAEPTAINAFDVDTGPGQSIVTSNDAHHLTYLSRAAS